MYPAVVMALLGGMLLGCDQPLWTFDPALNASPTTAPAAATQDEQIAPAAASSGQPDAVPTYIITTVTFDVLRTRVPAGVFSQSPKIWNHLQEEVLPAETVQALHRNGLRVARGQVDSWPPIKALLETQERVETSQTQLSASNGLPLLVELDAQPRDQLLFLYRRDGTLAGAPWPGSTNLLRVEYGVDPNQPDALLVEIMPQLRLDPSVHSGPRGAERWSPTPFEPPTLILRDLAFRMQVGPGQFVAIGPSVVTRELPYVIGSLMLCDEVGSEKMESMYFVTPRVSRVGGT